LTEENIAPGTQVQTASAHRYDCASDFPSEAETMTETHRGKKLILPISMLILTAFVFAGCGGVNRPPQEEAVLMQHREQAGRYYVADTRLRVIKLLERTKREVDDYAAGRRSHPPVIDFLVISGGGDYGAFGAGYLKGWGRVPTTNPMCRPHFDIVTGVSTGALIAPFAFLNDDESIDRVVQLYRNPQADWVRQRGLLFFLPNNISFAEVPGLERELKKAVTLEMAARIADGGKDGRMLAVGATNLDDASPRVFHLVPEAQRAVETKDMSRLYNIMLASAGIPGAFPYREIDGAMYVDGAVTNNLIYGGRLSEDDSLPAVWQERYPGVPIPKIRYWVIFNNQLRAPPTIVPARWFNIITRSVELASRSASLTSMRQLYGMAEISRLKRNADVEVRVVAIPDNWLPPVEGTFAKETMNSLADLGEKMGANPSSWRSDPPAP
jgi:hypothetical protein